MLSSEICLIATLRSIPFTLPNESAKVCCERFVGPIWAFFLPRKDWCFRDLRWRPRRLFSIGDISAQAEERPTLLTHVPISYGVAVRAQGPSWLHHTHTHTPTHSSYGSDTCRGQTKRGPLITEQHVRMDADFLTPPPCTHTHTDYPLLCTVGTITAL